MTPDRAREIMDAEYLKRRDQVDRDGDPDPFMLAAILAACREERREALTWAAKICRDWGDTVSANSIEAARDAEGR